MRLRRLFVHQKDDAAHLIARADERRAGHLALDGFSAPIRRLQQLFGVLTVAGKTRSDAVVQLIRRQADIEVQKSLAADFVLARPLQILGPRVPGNDANLAIAKEGLRGSSQKNEVT